jgi:spore photoproduct lyase
VRVYANLPEILGNLPAYVSPGDGTTSFEASCYTDPLAIEHLTGSLAETIRWFGTRDDMAGARLRWVSKFTTPALVAPLLALPHGGRTRARASVNAAPVARAFEPGVPVVSERLAGLGALARSGQPVGLVIAPIMPIDDWAAHYGALLDDARAALPVGSDLTIELITHRFTPGSRDTLRAWYPNSALEMDRRCGPRSAGSSAP